MARKYRTKWDQHPELTKITREQANEMREAYRTGQATTKELSEQYGLSRSHTYAIVTGSRWVR